MTDFARSSKKNLAVYHGEEIFAEFEAMAAI